MEQFLIALWLLCGVLVFLPVGAALRFARRGLAVLPPFAGDRDVIPPVYEHPAPPAATALPPLRAAPIVGSRSARFPLMLALYVTFVSGAVYYTRKFLPAGTALRLERRALAVLPPFAGDRDVILPVSEEPAPPAAPAVPPARAAPLVGSRSARLLLMLALYVAFVSGAVYYTPKFLSHALNTPYPMAAVTSSSMWPTLKKGDLVVLKGVDGPEDVQVGDIIAFRHEAGFAIHRVVSIEGEKITTQGDANDLADPPISIDDVVGRVARVMGHVIKVPYLGNIPLLIHRAAEAPPPESPPTFAGQEGVEAPGSQ